LTNLRRGIRIKLASLCFTEEVV
jgi:hypothetical protein